tara:strand:+ start:3605 stop:4537 length:933 start_codon:yes stop_codon:yes gene_type:complete
MAATLRETIKNITFKHLKKFKGQVFGQNLTGVGWVAGTLPKLYEKDGVIELPLADVANGGMVTGSALMGKRPFYIIRYQGYNWLNCIFISNYACKSKEIWDKPAPMFIRGLSNEGGLGPASTSSHISIFYKMPGIKIFSPMSNNEYLKVYKKFMREDEVFYISEHRKSYENKSEFKNTIKKDLDIILMPISVTRFEAEKAKNYLNKLGYKAGIIHLFELKPFILKKKWLNAIKKSKYGVLMTDNDYVDGILRTLAHKINEKTNQTINVMGLKDKSAGYTIKTSNFPPSASEIVDKVKSIISKKKRRKKNG